MDSGRYKQRYAAFYWTLSVRWTGFTYLKQEIEAAVQKSWTIRYQRELVRRWIEQNNGVRGPEIAIQSKHNDRMDLKVQEGFIAFAKEHCANGTKLLWVDFVPCGWRRHRLLEQAAAQLGWRDGREHISIPAEVLEFGNGERWDPADHFSHWRVSEKLAREERRLQVPRSLREAMEAIPETEWSRAKKIASWLNSQSVPTLGGGTVWTDYNVRKAIQNIDRIEADPEGEMLPGASPPGV